MKSEKDLVQYAKSVDKDTAYHSGTFFIVVSLPNRKNIKEYHLLMLAQTNGHTFCMISLPDGNRWNDPVGFKHVARSEDGRPVLSGKDVCADLIHGPHHPLGERIGEIYVIGSLEDYLRVATE